MADAKISALPASTTPLAGTEVLPVVQSGTTKQVSVANLTAGRAVSGASFAVTGSSVPANGIYLSAVNTVSVATNSAEKVQVNPSGQVGIGVIPYASVGGNGDLLQIGNPLTKVGSGLTIGATTTGDIQYSNAASGTGQYAGLLRYVFSTNTFSIWTNSASRVTVGSGGDTTLVTGNLVQGTAAKGVNFTANTPAAGMTSQLLNWYEEGTWTPNQGSGLTVVGAFSSVGRYTRTGNVVVVNFSFTGATSVTVNAGGNLCTNLPYTSNSSLSYSGVMSRAGLASGGTCAVEAGTQNAWATSTIAATGTLFCSVTYIV